MSVRSAYPVATTLLLAILCTLADSAGAGPSVSEPSFYPEGPTTVGNDVLWVEMTMDRVRRLSNGEVTTVWQETGCGPTSIQATVGGSYWVLCHLGHKVIRLSKTFAKELEVASDTAGNRIVLRGIALELLSKSGVCAANIRIRPSMPSSRKSAPRARTTWRWRPTVFTSTRLASSDRSA